jgi:hypothetical protein
VSCIYRQAAAALLCTPLHMKHEAQKHGVLHAAALTHTWLSRWPINAAIASLPGMDMHGWVHAWVALVTWHHHHPCCYLHTW